MNFDPDTLPRELLRTVQADGGSFLDFWRSAWDYQNEDGFFEPLRKLVHDDAWSRELWAMCVREWNYELSSARRTVQDLARAHGDLTAVYGDMADSSIVSAVVARSMAAVQGGSRSVPRGTPPVWEMVA